jgi:hypothetical protein
MTDRDAQTVARGLTPKQREAVLAHGEEYRRLCEGMGRGSATARLVAIKPLDGIFESAWDCDANRYRLTPLGLRVRALLEKERVG